MPCARTVAMPAPATPPVEHEDEEEVEHDVEQGREEQEPEGGPAVAQRADDAREEVVEEGAGNADEGDEQVDVGPLEDVLRRAHPLQDVVAKQRGDEGDGERHDGGQPQADKDQLPHDAVVARAELLGHRNAESTAASVAEAENQKDDRRAGSYRGQSVDAQKLAHDDRIDQRVGLLEQVAQQQGQRETQNLGQRPPRGHLLRNRHVYSFCSIYGCKDRRYSACLYAPGRFSPVRERSVALRGTLLAPLRG